eukprot:8449709-Ditylum_brightwellii.AAC.1
MGLPTIDKSDICTIINEKKTANCEKQLSMYKGANQSDNDKMYQLPTKTFPPLAPKQNKAAAPNVNSKLLPNVNSKQPSNVNSKLLLNPSPEEAQDKLTPTLTPTQHSTVYTGPLAPVHNQHTTPPPNVNSKLPPNVPNENYSPLDFPPPPSPEGAPFLGMQDKLTPTPTQNGTVHTGPLAPTHNLHTTPHNLSCPPSSPLLPA